MAKSPPKKPKDPAKPTRSKANRPDSPAVPQALADILNPALNKGTAGLGSGTGGSSTLQPPADNSWDRRSGNAAEHRARKSTRGFEEARQADYSASPITGIDPALAQELGLEAEDDASPAPRPAEAGDAKGLDKYRLPKADLPTGPGGLSSMGVAATAESL